MFSDSPLATSAFSALGNISVSVAVTGVQGTTGLGNETVVAKANVFPTGVNVTGKAGTTTVGSVTVVEGTGVSVAVTGEAGTTTVGDVTITADANANVT